MIIMLKLRKGLWYKKINGNALMQWFTKVKETKKQLHAVF